MRGRKTVLRVLITSLLLLGIILFASTAQGSESVATEAVVRSFSGPAVSGQDVEVTVTFASPTDGFHAIGLIELAPAGWNVTVDVAWTEPQAMVAHAPKPEEAVYIWAGPYEAGTSFTALYKVCVPVDAQSGSYIFAGSLEYYVEPYPAPSYQQQVTGDAQMEVAATMPVRIAGVTREVNGAILPGAAVTLSQDGEAVARVMSDEDGKYQLEFFGLGPYEVVVTKDGFRKETQCIVVPEPGTYTLDFVGDHGLIPGAPSTSYVLACANLWKFGQPPLRLGLSKALDVISAWKYPA